MHWDKLHQVVLAVKYKTGVRVVSLLPYKKFIKKDLPRTQPVPLDETIH